MKRLQHRVIAAALTAITLTAAPLSALAASEEAAQPFAVMATSNFFPNAGMVYDDLGVLRDNNGELFVQVDYKLAAHDMYVVNMQMDELTWDPAVLEFKEAYNMIGKGRSARLGVFAFTEEQNRGGGMCNTFGDENGGRIVGNYSNISNPAFADEEDGSPVSVVRAVFKVLNPHARRTTVNCVMSVLCFDDVGTEEQGAKYPAIIHGGIRPAYYALGTYSTTTTPGGVIIGDTDSDDALTINDATALQACLSEFTALDLTDETTLLTADYNGDDRVNIKDVTALQRTLAGIK